jgi:hypothetical protein
MFCDSEPSDLNFFFFFFAVNQQDQCSGFRTFFHFILADVQSFTVLRKWSALTLRNVERSGFRLNEFAWIVTIMKNGIEVSNRMASFCLLLCHENQTSHSLSNRRKLNWARRLNIGHEVESLQHPLRRLWHTG